MWALENPKTLHFNKLLLAKVYNAWAKKSIGELCLMALKLMQNLKETDLCFLKIFVGDKFLWDRTNNRGKIINVVYSLLSYVRK